MWFDNKEQPVPDADDKKIHRSPEERIEAGEEFATFEDLDGLDERTLLQIALDCDENADPDACVACRAYARWEEIQEDNMARAAATLENPLGVEEEVDDDHGALEEEEPSLVLDENVPPGKILLGDHLPEEETDLRVQFIEMVHGLDLAVRRLMEGPPIPPPNVTLDDLALLSIGSREWIKSTEGLELQGFVLPPEKQQIREQVQRLLERMGA